MTLKDGHWWDAGSWWRYRLIGPLAWKVAGLRDRRAVRRANRHRDIVG